MVQRLSCCLGLLHPIAEDSGPSAAAPVYCLGIWEGSKGWPGALDSFHHERNLDGALDFTFVLSCLLRAFSELVHERDLSLAVFPSLLLLRFSNKYYKRRAQ